MDEIMLSILVPTYGHEKYIAQALDSILMQNTQYSYEILVGEDASPDCTRNILKQYEMKYPSKFQMYYREKNMNSSFPSNIYDLRMRAKGKYLIMLEGDDYWTDPYKIEKQVSFLEKNPDYIAVAHNCIVVDKDGVPIGKQYLECKDKEYTLRHFRARILPGQTATFMYKNIYKDNMIDYSLLKKGLQPGDKLLYFVMVLHGKIYCMQEKMSAYRYVTNEGHSFSANYIYKYKEVEHWNKELLDYAKLMNNPEAERTAELCYFSNIVSGLKAKCITLKEAKTDCKKIRHKGNIFYLYVINFIIRKINRIKYKYIL